MRRKTDSLSVQALFRACAFSALPGLAIAAPGDGAGPRAPVFLPPVSLRSTPAHRKRRRRPRRPSRPGATSSPPLVPPPGLTDLPPTAPAPTISGIGSSQSGSSGSAAPALTGKVARITIRGNSAISTEAIRAYVAQKIGSPYNPTLADRDRDQIKGMGYFNGDIGLSRRAQWRRRYRRDLHRRRKPADQEDRLHGEHPQRCSPSIARDSSKR